MKPLIVPCATLALAVLALVGSVGTSTAQSPSNIHVTLREFTVQTDPSAAEEGQVTFIATNSGTVQHQLLVIKTDLAPDALPLSGPRVVTSDVDVVGQLEPFDAGTTKTLSTELTPGNYVLICNVAGHYQAGMHAALTVATAPETPRATQEAAASPTPPADNTSLPRTGTGPQRSEQSRVLLDWVLALVVAGSTLVLAARGLRTR